MSGISSSLAQPIFVFSVLIISFKENLPKWNIDQCLSEISTCSGKRLWHQESASSIQGVYGYPLEPVEDVVMKHPVSSKGLVGPMAKIQRLMSLSPAPLPPAT